MKNVLMPALAAVLFAAACGDSGDSIAVDTTARVRFFNATTGMVGSGAFTANGQFASGSALAFGQSSQSCSSVNSGLASFGFGNASTAGTGLSGNALMTLNNQSLAAGGNYTMVATGAAASPQLYLLENSFNGSLSSNQAAYRVVNLAPGPNVVPYNWSVFIGGGLPPVGTIVGINILLGAPTEFKTATSGNNVFTFLIGHEFETITDATVNLQAGSVNTIAIVPKMSGGYELINIPRC